MTMYPSSSYAGAMRRESTGVLASDSPSFDGDDNGSPGHKQSSEAHRDGEDEHGVQSIGLECRYSVEALGGFNVSNHKRKGTGQRLRVAYTAHEDETTSDKAESGDDFRRRSRWEERGWR